MDEVQEQHDSSPEASRFHDLGIRLARQQQFEEAAKWFAKAVELDPTRTDALRHLAQANADAGRLEDAESAWLRYVAERPEAADAFRHLGNLRKRMDRLDLAVDALHQAAKLDAKSTPILVDYGIALAAAHREKDARKAFEKALENEPDSYDAHINLGMLLQQMKDSKLAVEHLHRAIELKPDDPSGYNNLGVALSEQGKSDEAIACFKSLLEKWPDYVLAWNNLGNALRAAGHYQEAIEALTKATTLKPDYVEAYNNLGIIYAQAEDFDKAIAAYGRAMLLRPDYPEAHANRGLIYLLLGNFQQGWADYEWRWQGAHGMKRRQYPGKLWDGSPLSGKRILLYFEQGLGDTFQFIRYAKDLHDRGATVIFECQPHMRQILGRTPGIDEYVTRGDRPPRHDFYAPLLSLPGLCQTHLDNLPRRIPYIFGDPALQWEWKQRLAELDGMRIGIVWQGNPDHKGDRNRSIPLRCFEPLAKLDGVTLVSLQRNFGVEQIEKLDGLFPLHLLEEDGAAVDGWLRTAAIISNLDLMICADTSVAHLAGAMGVPVWIAISISPDWRWLVERDDTPWYPTMRLFRQKQSRDWPELFARMTDALRERLNVFGKTLRNPATDADQLESRRLLRKAAEHLSHEQVAEAQPLLEQAVRLDPTSSAAQQDLGVTYAKQGKINEAIACFRRLERAPDAAGLYANLGLATFHAGRIEESVSHLRKAIWLGASSADTHKNLARALMATGDAAGAEECYWAALKLKPDDAEAHYHLARALLMQGKFEQGWLELEWRWKWPAARKNHSRQPRWSGQSLQDQRLLILSEADPRDTIALARYADVFRQQGARVFLSCQPALVQLMSGCLGVEAVGATGTPPPHDYHAYILSLPATVGTTLQSLPASRPYLGVKSNIVDHWRDCLADLPGLKVGIALCDDDAPAGKRPSALLHQCAQRLGDIPNISLMRLQEDHENLWRGGARSLKAQFSDGDDPVAATAAAMRNLDLVICTDNLVAHIAGAMGIATWLLLPLAPDSRWMQTRENSPWYPTMRLFRQRRREDWDEVTLRVYHELRRLCDQR